MAKKNYGISCNSLNVAFQYQDPLESNDPDPKSKPFGEKLFLGIIIAILISLMIIGGAYFPGLFAILTALSSLMAGNVTPPKDSKHPKRYILSIFLVYIFLAIMYAIIYFTAMTVSAAILLQLIVFGSIILASIIIESKKSKTKA